MSIWRGMPACPGGARTRPPKQPPVPSSGAAPCPLANIAPPNDTATPAPPPYVNTTAGPAGANIINRGLTGVSCVSGAESSLENSGELAGWFSGTLLAAQFVPFVDASVDTLLIVSAGFDALSGCLSSLAGTPPAPQQRG